jgi:hypothetical protein
MEVQLPTAPARLQAWHVPPQAALQHTPSVQKPEPHWLAALQDCPSTFFTRQAPALQ